MKEMLQKLREASVAAILQADDITALENLRVKYLGKKGELTAILKQMGRLSAEERPAMGQLANQVRAELEEALDQRRETLNARMLEMRLKAETLDVTMPGKAPELGHQHPMYIVLDEIKDIFVGMGFEILEGPEIEEAEYNFTKLNTSEGHPAREWSDTFYLTEDSSILLRTQTSPDAGARHGEQAAADPHGRPPAASTARMRWTPRTRPCSTRSRAWSSTRASRWRT